MLATDASLDRLTSYMATPEWPKIAAVAARVVDPEAEDGMPGYMKPQKKDLKSIVEKLEGAARAIKWNQARGPDALLIGVKIFLPPDIISAITADFLLLTSEEIFKARVHRWKYAQDYGQALWDVVKVLVEDLRKDLITRHEVVLQKQRGARLHTWIMANKFDSVRHVRLILPTQGTSKPTVASADMATIRPIDNITAEVPPAHFYASSPKKQVPNRRKRKATEQLQSAESLKRRKEADKENLSPEKQTTIAQKTGKRRTAIRRRKS
ncbi:hypothetical protein B0H14DRAFT_3430988 [Mycena olivaceomarginata]|nr:hypothetical protein B0H14DRAFT_3430988 [Mycena olivaceomarginata]